VRNCARMSGSVESSALFWWPVADVKEYERMGSGSQVVHIKRGHFLYVSQERF